MAAYANPNQQRPGGGFMAGAMQTAMGVAGGVLLGNAIGGMFAGDAAASEAPAEEPMEDETGYDDAECHMRQPALEQEPATHDQPPPGRHLLQLRLVLRHVPEDDVIVRLLHARVAGVVVDVDVIDGTA